MGVEHSRVVLADEDVEEDPDRWCSYTECGKATLANCVPMGVEPAAHPGKDECLEVSFVRWSGPHLQKRLPFSFLRKIRPKRTARWQCAGEAGQAVGRFTADAFTCAATMGCYVVQRELPSG